MRRGRRNSLLVQVAPHFEENTLLQRVVYANAQAIEDFTAQYRAVMSRNTVRSPCIAPLFEMSSRINLTMYRHGDFE